MPATLNWPRKSIGGGCQSSEMASLLNSLSFAFTNSFLPKYRVKYCDYIAGLKIRGILVANATMFCRLLPGFSCGSKHLLLP